jgi:hypothetical protein
MPACPDHHVVGQRAQQHQHVLRFEAFLTALGETQPLFVAFETGFDAPTALIIEGHVGGQDRGGISGLRTGTPQQGQDLLDRQRADQHAVGKGNCFPELSDLLQRRLIQSFDLDMEGLQAALEKELLSENEPRSLAAVARSLGYPVQILKRFFPSVCQQIIARRKLHQKRRRELRQQKIQEEVQRVVLHIHAEYKYPSFKHTLCDLLLSWNRMSLKGRKYWP